MSGRRWLLGRTELLIPVCGGHCRLGRLFRQRLLFFVLFVQRLAAVKRLGGGSNGENGFVLGEGSRNRSCRFGVNFRRNVAG